MTGFLWIAQQSGANLHLRFQPAMRIGLSWGWRTEIHAIERVCQEPLRLLHGLHQIRRHQLQRLRIYIRKWVRKRARPKIIKVSTFGHQTDTRYSMRTYIRLNSFGIYESSKGNY